MKKRELRLPAEWTPWAVALGTALLTLGAVRLLGSVVGGGGDERPVDAGPPSKSSFPTVQCADGTKSYILTRAAQKDACAGHGGISRLLVPPYRPQQRPRATASRSARKQAPRNPPSKRALRAPHNPNKGRALAARTPLARTAGSR